MGDEIRTYTHHDAPEVEALWDGEWCYGTLHQWRREPDGRWTGWIRINVGPGKNRIEILDQDRIRLLPPESRPSSS